ncbi:MAG: aspartate aminotransferase family protein [Bryobacteraceae bacterium]
MSTTQTAPNLDFTARIESVRNKTTGSRERFARAGRSLAGGVSSGLRRSMSPYPLFFRQGDGARVEDVDGNRYIDYGLAWGPLILGHSHPAVVAALRKQASRATTYGAQHDLEYQVAERLKYIIPCADLISFANSGTEIVQVALRLARAVTGRQRFLKFEGHYHGWGDSVLVSYQPTEAQLAEYGRDPVPVGRGQRPNRETLVAEWNDSDAVERIFADHGSEISAVICEPLLCNCFCIPPAPGFLERLRELTLEHGALLIFDEVITGFRIGLQGAQGHYGVTPDLATYAKAVGAGTPLSVLAGRRQYMDLIASGEVVHAGTLNGNPLSLAAANAALDVLSAGNGAVFEKMSKTADRLRSGIESELRRCRMPVVSAGLGPVFHISFMSRPARNYRETLAADRRLYADFAAALLDEGVLALQDGRWYVSAVHDDKAIDETLAAVRRVLA